MAPGTFVRTPAMRAAASSLAILRGQGRVHGGFGTPEYRAWRDAKARTSNPGHKNWVTYGARGITMAPEWLRDFAAFLTHIGPRPVGLSLDRINPYGNYEPGNVRWATRSQQRDNQRSGPQSAPAACEEA